MSDGGGVAGGRLDAAAGFDVADDCLAASRDVDMFDSNFLLALELFAGPCRDACRERRLA